MDESAKYVKGSAWGVLGRALAWLFALGLCAAILFPVFATPRSGHGRSCTSNLKQLSIGVIIYMADADDRLPPFFTFDGERSTKALIAATIVYLKSDQLYLCPQDKGYPDKNQVGPNEKMSYVHPLALIGVIPNFNKGYRTLNVAKDIAEVSTVAMLRDPIRVDSKEDKSKLCSPHGEGFNVSFLDGHAKFSKHLDINTEL